MKTFLLAWSLSLGVPVFEAKSVSLFGKRLCPAGSGRFRRKWSPISPCVLDFWTVFGGGCRRWLRRPGETSAPRGVSGRFGLRNRPEVANGACERQGRGSKRCEARRIRGAQGVRRVPKGMPCAGGLTSVNRREQGTEVCSFPNVPPSPGHVRLHSYIAAACASGAWQSPCGGGAALFLSTLAVKRRQGAPGLPSCAVARKKRRWTLFHAACVRLTIEEKCRL